MALWRFGETEAANYAVIGDGEVTNMLPTTLQSYLHYRMIRLGFDSCAATALVARQDRPHRCGGVLATTAW